MVRGSGSHSEFHFQFQSAAVPLLEVRYRQVHQQAVTLASDSVDNLIIKEVHNKFSCSLVSCYSYHGLSLGV